MAGGLSMPVLSSVQPRLFIHKPIGSARILHDCNASVLDQQCWLMPCPNFCLRVGPLDGSTSLGGQHRRHLKQFFHNFGGGDASGKPACLAPVRARWVLFASMELLGLAGRICMHAVMVQNHMSSSHDIMPKLSMFGWHELISCRSALHCRVSWLLKEATCMSLIGTF